MKTNNIMKLKFRGGVRIGARASSWPFGIFKIKENSLMLSDISSGKDIEFLKDDIKNIEILKIFFIKHGVRIHSNNPKQNDMFCFWYFPGRRFNDLFSALKEFNYL
jgi:hypothetical protein